MNHEQKALNLLGLAQRASQLLTGDERVEKALKAGKIDLLIIASDVSERTAKRYHTFSQQYQVPLDQHFNTYRISEALGKKRSICGITERGLAQRYLSYFTEKEVPYDITQ